jgi:hypothetical protein
LRVAGLPSIGPTPGTPPHTPRSMLRGAPSPCRPPRTQSWRRPCPQPSLTAGYDTPGARDAFPRGAHGKTARRHRGGGLGWGFIVDSHHQRHHPRTYPAVAGLPFGTTSILLVFTVANSTVRVFTTLMRTGRGEGKGVGGEGCSGSNDGRTLGTGGVGAGGPQPQATVPSGDHGLPWGCIWHACHSHSNPNAQHPATSRVLTQGRGHPP